MEVIKTADWIVDMGPDGGDSGGQIIFQGTPENLAKINNSYTWDKFLNKILINKVKKNSLRSIIDLLDPISFQIDIKQYWRCYKDGRISSYYNAPY